MFDPYRKWLGIPESQRPPTHYQLLGISADEQDRDVINAAVVRQSAFVRNFQVGPHSDEATRVLNEIAAAKVCLLDPVKRAEYDRQLAAAARPKSILPNGDQPSGRLDGLRSSSVLAPPSNQPSRPALRPTPSATTRAGGYPAAATPRVSPSQSTRRPRPPAPSPLVSIPAATWQAGDSDSPVPQWAPAGPPRNGPPLWIWFVPIGVCLSLAIVLIAAAATRRSPPKDNVAHVAPPTVELGPAIQQPAPSPFPNSAANGPPVYEPPRANVPPARVPPRANPPESRKTPPQDPPSNDFFATAPSAPAPEPPDPSSANAPEAALPFDDSAGWTDESTLALSVPRSAPVVFARAGGPSVAIGSTVYSLDDGREVGQTGDNNDEFDPQTLRALSGDGKYFAIARRGLVEVRRCQDGEKVSSLPGEWTTVRLEFLDFGSPAQLITAARYGADEHLEVWEVATGKLLKKFTIESIGRNAALTDDGRYFAVELHNQGILIYDILKSPSKGKGKISARIPIAPLQRRFLNLDGFRFSPSSDELAAVCDDGARVLCWNKKTEPIFQHSLGTEFHSLGMGAFSYRGPVLEWQPAGRGWLLAGHAFLDRKLRRVTWLLKSDLGSTIRHRFLDDDRLIAIRETNNRRDLVDVKIPWKKIDDSLAAMHDMSTAAWLGPGRQVSLRVQLGQVAGTPEEAEADLRTALAARLAADKVGVADDAAVNLVAEYAEEYKAPRTIAPPNIPGMRVNPPPFQTSGSTSVRLTLRLQTTETAKELWTGSLRVHVNHNSGAESPRQAINAELAAQLQATLLPYFLPQDNSLVPLPVVISP